MKTVTKAYFVGILEQEMGCKKTQAKQVVDVFFEALKDAVIHSERIEIRGFGAWRILETKPKPNARDPRTGETISVPARRKVIFKPGKILKNGLSRPIHRRR